MFVCRSRSADTSNGGFAGRPGVQRRGVAGQLRAEVRYDPGQPGDHGVEHAVQQTHVLGQPENLLEP